MTRDDACNRTSNAAEWRVEPFRCPAGLWIGSHLAPREFRVNIAFRGLSNGQIGHGENLPEYRAPATVLAPRPHFHDIFGPLIRVFGIPNLERAVDPSEDVKTDGHVARLPAPFPEGDPATSRPMRRATQDDSGRSSSFARSSARSLVSRSSRTATTSVFTGFFIQAPLIKVYNENVYLYTSAMNIGQGHTA